MPRGGYVRERFHGAKVRDDLGVMGAIMPRRGHLTVPALPKKGAGEQRHLKAPGEDEGGAMGHRMVPALPKMMAGDG